ncbi:MAG: hypothetical protein AAF251_09740 [Pseudomonadota bacterium]
MKRQLSTSLQIQIILIRVFACIFTLFAFGALYSEWFGDGSFLDGELSTDGAIGLLLAVVGVWFGSYLALLWFEELDTPRTSRN